MSLDSEFIINEFRAGKSPNELAILLGVHPTTIRRYLRKAGLNKQKSSHVKLISPQCKNTLKRILVENGVKNIDFIINDIDRELIVTKRNKEEYEIIQLEEL